MPAHQIEGIIEFIKLTGARLLYFLPYPPDLNPIEMAWSKVKRFLRKIQARTKEALYQALVQALTLKILTLDQAKAYLSMTEYVSNLVGGCYISPRYQFPKRSTS